MKSTVVTVITKNRIKIPRLDPQGTVTPETRRRDFDFLKAYSDIAVDSMGLLTISYCFIRCRPAWRPSLSDSRLRLLGKATAGRVAVNTNDLVQLPPIYARIFRF